MYAPLRIARRLAAGAGRGDVRFSVDHPLARCCRRRPGYADPHRDSPSRQPRRPGRRPGARFAYNVRPAVPPAAGSRRSSWSSTTRAVVTPRADWLPGCWPTSSRRPRPCRRVLVVARRPPAPERTPVTRSAPLPCPAARARLRLLRRRRGDLAAHRPLRRRPGGPIEEREEAIQSGAAHYAESLPVEYQPTPSTRSCSTTRWRDRGRGSRARRRRGDRAGAGRARARTPVLVSLARAGTPIGILMRRWARGRARPRAAALRDVASSGAAASTGSRCATWPPTTTRRRWCSSTAGPARARSPAS